MHGLVESRNDVCIYNWLRIIITHLIISYFFYYFLYGRNILEILVCNWSDNNLGKIYLLSNYRGILCTDIG